jgi:group I intron endonuclease
MAYIYKITNVKNGKIYIGKTIHSLSIRWSQHCNDSRTKQKCKYLSRAIEKYGTISFRIDPLLIVREEDLDYYETECIRVFNSTNPNIGYNLMSGGQGGRPNAIARAHMSASQKGNRNCVGRKLSEETKDKIGSSHRGKYTDKQKEAAKTRKRWVLSPEAKESHRIAQLGKVFSEEHRRNIGLSTKERWKNPEMRKRMLRHA